MVVPSALFSVAVDLIVLTIRGGRLEVLVVERNNPPFKSRLALPGGFVRSEEDFEAAALRELQEETSIEGVSLEQVRTYGAPNRDPRGRIVSVAYLAFVPDPPAPVAGTDAANAQWISIAEGRHLAFDHDIILHDAIARARTIMEHTPAALKFCHELFTLDELRTVYEAIWDLPLDPSDFRREVARIQGFVVPVGRRLHRLRNSSNALHRRGEARTLYPPMKRPLRSAQYSHGTAQSSSR